MLLLLTVLAFTAQSQAPTESPGLTLRYMDSLAPGAERPLGEKRFWFSQPQEWSYVESVADDGLGNPVPDSGPGLYFKSTRTYTPRVRSPHSIALLRRHYLAGDFTLEVEAMQAGIETAHRDLVLVFGFQSPEQFYYCHLGAVGDATSSNVFEVNESARRRMGEISTKPIHWGRGVWHQLRLECTRAGRMRLFIDGAKEPHFEQELGRNPAGLVGFGSFDDAGAFRNLKLYAKSPLLSPWDPNDPHGNGPHWASNPFGGVVAGSAKDGLKLMVGKSERSVVLLDADGDGTKGSKGDRWDWASAQEEAASSPDRGLPLDAASTIWERLSVQPVLDETGAFSPPYEFRVAAPAQSMSALMRAKYDASSQGHPAEGPWDWATDSWTFSADKRHLLVAVTPHHHAESWRWDAEVFSNPRVKERLAREFAAERVDSSPTLTGLLPFVSVSFGGDASQPKLVMLTHEGNLLGTTTKLTSPESLLKWLDETSKAAPSTVRRYHFPRGRRY